MRVSKSTTLLIFVFSLFLLKCWLCPCPFPKCYFWDELSPLAWWKPERENNVSGPERMSVPPHGVDCQFPMSQSLCHLSQLAGRRQAAFHSSTVMDRMPQATASQHISAMRRLNELLTELFTLAGALVVFRTLFWWGYQTSETTSENTFLI